MDTDNQPQQIDNATVEPENKKENKNKNKKSRCGCCKKKLVLTECTCGVLFCPMHIAPGSHCCSRILKKNDINFSDISGLSIKATGAFDKIQYI
tara:strand:+ start:219 stop:500 length:282 start_codon:yes stop_codon:yes gene_type:complete